MHKQSGSVLLIMMLILISAGSLFLYAALNQTSQQMKHAQTQLKVEQLNEIKQMLILFAWNPEQFCTNLTHTGYLPQPVDNRLPDTAGGQFFGFEQYEAISNNIIYQVADLDYTSDCAADKPDNKCPYLNPTQDANAALEPIATITWASSLAQANISNPKPPTAYIFGYEISSDSTCTPP